MAPSLPPPRHTHPLPHALLPHNGLFVGGGGNCHGVRMKEGSRLKFLTRKWQRATRRGAPTSSTVNGHAAVSRTEVLRQQHPGANHISSPPTRDSSPILIPPMKSPFRLQHRVYSSPTLAAERTGEASQEAERSLTEYIHHLEKVQQRLGGGHSGSATVLSYPKKSDF